MLSSGDLGPHWELFRFQLFFQFLKKKKYRKKLATDLRVNIMKGISKVISGKHLYSERHHHEGKRRSAVKNLVALSGKRKSGQYRALQFINP